ncbi:MAG: hypothetical protein JOS17DRAFT_741467 [Linnemannia elongata]|nr:MAG: hypothetical protein JOS17DRAFT_741467 [Linnemannia elongata]
MTSTYDTSDVADSFEDLSSLSSDKDIESLVLATTYSDNDDDDLGDDCKASDNHLEVNGKEKKEENGDHPTKVNDDDDDDDGFVDLAGTDVEDVDDVLSVGWESSRSTSPEPQCVHLNLFTKPESSLPENQASNRLGQDDDTSNSNDKKDPVATTTEEATTNNTKQTSASSIPRIITRMTKDISAAFNLPIPSASVAIVSLTPPERVVATPSHLRPGRQKAANTTTPDDGSVPSPQAKHNTEPKKAVRTKLSVASTVDQPTVPSATVEPSVSSATGAAAITTGKNKQQEEGDSICKAIRRSTRKRCTRHGRHDGYCSTHRLLVN